MIDLSLVVKELRVSEAFFGSFCAQDIKLGLAQAERLRVFPYEKNMSCGTLSRNLVRDLDRERNRRGKKAQQAHDKIRTHYFLNMRGAFDLCATTAVQLIEAIIVHALSLFMWVQD